MVLSILLCIGQPLIKESYLAQSITSVGVEKLYWGLASPPLPITKLQLALISGIKADPSFLNTTFQQTHLGLDPGKPEGSGQEEQLGEEKQYKHD